MSLIPTEERELLLSKVITSMVTMSVAKRPYQSDVRGEMRCFKKKLSVVVNETGAK